MPLLRTRPDLLAAFRRGERAALAEVYWGYVDRVERTVRYGFSTLKAGVRVQGAPPDEIADVVQETFLRAFAEPARRAYDGTRDYGPYLAQIARNLLVDRARKTGRERSLDGLLGESDDFDPPDVPSEPEAWTDAATLRVLSEYLASLDPEMRAFYEARYEGGLSQEQAAAVLGCSRQQLRTREAQLREGLARALRAANLGP